MNEIIKSEYVVKKTTLDSILYVENIIEYCSNKDKNGKIQKRKYHEPEVIIKDIILDAVERTNFIMFHLSHFTKLYLCYLNDSGESFPIIDEQFMMNAMRAITYVNINSGKITDENKFVIDKLNKFLNDHYIKYIPDNKMISRSDIKDILNEEISSYVVKINTNIELNYIMRLKEYINIHFNIKKMRDDIHNNNNLGVRSTP